MLFSCSECHNLVKMLNSYILLRNRHKIDRQIDGEMHTITTNLYTNTPLYTIFSNIQQHPKHHHSSHCLGTLFQVTMEGITKLTVASPFPGQRPVSAANSFVISYKKILPCTCTVTSSSKQRKMSVHHVQI